MALPSPFDYGRRPDYISGVGEALGGVAKTVNDFSPAHPLIAQALRRIYGGEDPRAVAVETKFAMARERQAPDLGNLPSAPAMGGAPTSRAEFTGPREVTSEETIVAPSQPRSSMPLPSEPSTSQAFYSQGQPPILNRDLPVLMQGANLVRKDESNDLGYLNYLLGRDKLTETTSNRLGMQPGRDARTDATRANTARLPFLDDQRKQNTELRRADVGIKGGQLDTRRTENFLRGAGPSLDISAGMSGLIRQGLANPEIVGAMGDYTQRRVAEVLGNLPLLGNFIQSALTTGADEELTFSQREFKRQAAAEASSFIHSRFGASLTGHELELANRIAGGQLSVADTLAGLQIISALAQRKASQYQRGYPDVAAQIGLGESGPPIPLPPAPVTSPATDLQQLDNGAVVPDAWRRR